MLVTVSNAALRIRLEATTPWNAIQKCLLNVSSRSATIVFPIRLEVETYCQSVPSVLETVQSYPHLWAWEF